MAAKRNIQRAKVFYCTLCKGSGNMLVISVRGIYESIECDRCNGTGMIVISVACPSCDGVGSVFHGSSELECPDCRGTGRYQ